jgi:NitT/TauT family transport system substrate-binding protein
MERRTFLQRWGAASAGSRLTNALFADFGAAVLTALKKTWVIVAVMACTPSIGLDQANSSQLQKPNQPLAVQEGSPSMPGTQRKIAVVIGASTGFGLSYLPLMIMEDKKLLEKHAAALGFNATMQFQRFPTSAPMYDALLSGKLDFASGGVTQLLTSWDKTRSNPNLHIKGVGTLNSMPLYLVTSNPKVTTIADFTSKDKIAMVAVHTSIEAVILEMAAEKEFGNGQVHKLDPLTVSLGHPESMKALLSGKSDIDAHIASAPFMYEELAKPGIHKVLDSYKVLGGPHTHNVVWTTTKFHDANPQIVAAFADALQEALDQIKADPAAAASLYLRFENVKNMSAAQLEEIIRKPENKWTMTPEKFMAFAAFMNETGLISTEPADWHELFFDNITEGD